MPNWVAAHHSVALFDRHRLPPLPHAETGRTVGESVVLLAAALHVGRAVGARIGHQIGVPRVDDMRQIGVLRGPTPIGTELPFVDGEQSIDGALGGVQRLAGIVGVGDGRWRLEQIAEARRFRGDGQGVEGCA